MSKLLHEQISAFMDGELPAEECELLLRRLAVNRELARHWHAYHLIGDAMRDQLGSGAAHKLASRVKRALAVPEPAHAMRQRPRRYAMVAAGVAVLGLAGMVGALVSQQIGGGKVFTSGGSPASHVVGAGPAQQIGWQQAPSPVRAELNRYLMMHSLYGPTTTAMDDGSTGNAVVMTPAAPLPAASSGRGFDPR